MELIEKQGYKQTEVGVIPQDWEVKDLGDVGKIKMGQSPLSSNYNNQGIGLPLVQGNADVNNRKTIIRNFTSQITKKAIAGEIIMSVRAPVGEISKTEFDCCIGRGVCSISYTNDYLYHYLIHFENSWTKFSTGSTFDSVNSNQVKSIRVPLPPTLTEQKAIATALSDVDALISSLEKLITKKKAIKQGAMQELLTPPLKGGKRLPGFSGDWVKVTLGDIGQCIIGLTYSPSNVKDSGTLVLRSSNIQDGRFSSHDNVYVDCDIPDKLKVQKNDILVCVRNGSRNLIGKSLKLSNALVGQTWGAFMSVYRSSYNDYVAHLFNSNIIQRQIEENLGATINQITNKTLNSFKVVIPKVIEEQKAIAQILSDMDLEIEALEAKKAKYQGIKQGMMQELLTGKTRLV